MTVAGVDVGTSGVRGVLLDDMLGVAARSERVVEPGRRSVDGGHTVEWERIRMTVREVLTDLCQRGAGPPGALSVSATSGSLGFRDHRGIPVGEVVAYDDTRHGSGTARVAGWRAALPTAARVIPLADAVLESLGAEPGATDWTNALKLGWDPAGCRWPDGEAAALADAGFLPQPVVSGTPAGRSPEGEPWSGALLMRGATDGCATQIAAGRLQPGEWTISLGTTITWKTVSPTAPTLPPGAYSHRLSELVWLPGAASNSGGGVLAGAADSGALAARDRTAVLPSTFAAYPLARRGERFPVADPAFEGFGLPPRDHPAFHAAVLEGTGYVIRLGIERLAGRGVPELDLIRFTGGGARSGTWMSVLASVLRRPVISAPGVDPALGAALIAAAGLRDQPVGTVDVPSTTLGPVREYQVDQGLRPSYAGGYSTFLGRMAEMGLLA